MANDDWYPGAGGLIPHGRLRHVGMYKLTTSTVAVFRGQPMDLDSNGGVVPATTGDSEYILGPVLGFTDIGTKGGLPSNLLDINQEAYLDGNNNSYVLIADDPDQLFEVQCDTGGTSLESSNIGNFATLIPMSTTVSGSTVTGWSSFGLDQDDAAGDTGGCCQVVALSERMNSDGSTNTAGSDYVKAIVRLTGHRLGGRGETSLGI